MRKIFLAVALTALLLVSCADVPDTVKERAENSSVTDSLESKELSSDSGGGAAHSAEYVPPVFDTVKNVTSNVEKVIGNKYQNLVIPEDVVIDVEPTDKAYIISGSCYETEGRVDTEKKLDDFSQLFTGEAPLHTAPLYASDFETENESLVKLGSEPVSREVWDSRGIKQPFPDSFGRTAYGYAREYTINISSGGTIDAVKATEWTVRESADDASASYDLRKEELSDISYRVAGQDYSLSDALSDADSYIKDKLAPFLDNCDTVRPRKLYVMDCVPDEDETAPEEHYYLIKYEKVLEGIPFSIYGIADQMPDHMYCMPFWVYLYEPGRVDRLFIQDFYRTDKTEQTELVTLDSALAHTEALLAPFEVYNIRKITLEYCANVKAVEDGRLDENPQLKYRPTWCFTLSEDRDCRREELEKRKVICVDAVDGKVCLWDDFQESYLFREGE